MQSNDVNAAGVNRKEAAYFGVPWEDAYRYAQAIKVSDTIHVSGQLSHDEKGGLIASAPLDESGKPAEFSMMEQQMRATTPMPSSSSRVGATLDNVVEKTDRRMMSDSAAAIPLRAGAPDDRVLARVFAAYVASATIWLVFTTAVGLLVSFKFAYPDFATTPALSFGRLRAIHTSGTFYAWASQALIGLALFIAARSSGVGKPLSVERYLCRRRLIGDRIGRFVEVDAGRRPAPSIPGPQWPWDHGCRAW